MSIIAALREHPSLVGRAYALILALKQADQDERSALLREVIRNLPAIRPPVEGADRRFPWPEMKVRTIYHSHLPGCAASWGMIWGRFLADGRGLDWVAESVLGIMGITPARPVTGLWLAQTAGFLEAVRKTPFTQQGQLHQ